MIHFKYAYNNRNQSIAVINVYNKRELKTLLYSYSCLFIVFPIISFFFLIITHCTYLIILITFLKSYRETTEKEISTLLVERKIASTNLEILRSHYDALVGRRSQAAIELSRQPIQLPNEKDELEHLTLKLYEENLSFR